MITKVKTNHPGITKIIRANGETVYRLIISVGKTADGRETQECHTTRTLGDALKLQAEIRDARGKGRFVKRTAVTFDELCQRWLDSRHDIREVTRNGYRDALKEVRERLGRAKVQNLSRTDIDNVVKAMVRQTLSHRTISYKLGVIRMVLDYGISDGLLAVNVAAFVKVPRKQSSKAPADLKPKTEPWSQEELLKFRALTDQHEWAAAWRLTMCGLRRSEVMGLSWDCVDLDKGEIRIERGRVLVDGHRTVTDDPKSAASRRTVPIENMHPGTVALLRALSARQKADKLLLGPGYQETGLVLVDPLGAPVRPELYSDRFRKLCDQAGIRSIHLHLVRHTLAVALIRAGVSIVDAAALLGHTPAVFVDRYLRKSEAGVQSAASALGAAFAGASL